MEATEVYRALWRHKLLIAVGTLALVGAVAFLTLRQQPVYEASTLVRVQQQVLDPAESFTALATGQKLAQTYADIAPTSTIASGVYNELHGAVGMSAINGAISAQPVQDLDLLWIAARSTDPRVAQQIANAVPGALQRFIDATGTLRDHVIVAERAAEPTSPVSPRVTRNLALAFFTALVLNSGLALLVHALRDTVGGSDELERLTSLPVLASVPTLRFAPGADRPPPSESRHVAKPSPIRGGAGG